MLSENNRDHLADFVRLNEEWISTYFTVEDADRKLAAKPDQVLDDGGYIFSLLENGEVVGVCALFREDNGVFELARMAVSPQHQGKGYANTLMQACLEKLHEIEASKVYLLSNTKLEAAIALYKKFGFKTVRLGVHPVYSRANIVMERDAF
jgi:N-acetylglutamate synthase-like GNAT family acetyltransferase